MNAKYLDHIVRRPSGALMLEKYQNSWYKLIKLYEIIYLLICKAFMECLHIRHCAVDNIRLWGGSLGVWWLGFGSLNVTAWNHPLPYPLPCQKKEYVRHSFPSKGLQSKKVFLVFIVVFQKVSFSFQHMFIYVTVNCATLLGFLMTESTVEVTDILGFCFWFVLFLSLPVQSVYLPLFSVLCYIQTYYK